MDRCETPVQHPAHITDVSVSAAPSSGTTSRAVGRRGRTHRAVRRRAASHADAAGVWVVTVKRSRGAYVSYPDLVDEALCFGWIDSLPRALDDARTMRLMTHRRPGSSWSAVNKQRIARLTTDGRMHPAGQRAVQAAMRDGSWVALDAVETLAEPDDLRTCLDTNPAARKHWDTFPRSARRAILEWISTARTEDIRRRRIAQTIDEAALGRRANQWRQPKTR